MNEVTELQGCIGFILSSLFCLYVIQKIRTHNASQEGLYLWVFILVITLLSAVETQLSFRFLIKPYIVEFVTHFMAYSERHDLQVLVIGVFLAALVSCFLLFVFTKQLSSSLKVAVSGCASIICVFSLAVISLHSIDAIFYAPLFHVYVVCWLWNISAALIIVGAVMEIKKVKNTH